MNSWDEFQKMVGEAGDPVDNPVAEMLQEADFSQPPWKERWELYQNLRLRIGKALGFEDDEDLPRMIERLDSSFYRYYVDEFYPRRIKELQGLFKKLNATFDRHAKGFLGNKRVSMLQGGDTLVRLISTARLLRDHMAHFNDQERKGSLREEIFNLYQNLLVTNPKHAHKKGTPLSSRIKNYVRQKQGMEASEKVNLDFLAAQRSQLLLEALAEVKTPLYSITDKSTLLWIARFLRNFEECYRLPDRLFNFRDDVDSEAAVVDKLRRIIDRQYRPEGAQKNLQKLLDKWNIGEKNGSYFYRKE